MNRAESIENLRQSQERIAKLCKLIDELPDIGVFSQICDRVSVVVADLSDFQSLLASLEDNGWKRADIGIFQGRFVVSFNHPDISLKYGCPMNVVFRDSNEFQSDPFEI